MNLSNLVRHGAPMRLRVAAFALSASGAVMALLVFLPPLFAKFTSDTFYLYERARAQSTGDVIGLFVPASDNWFRPVTDLLFWVEAQAFGQEPIGYHLIALASHLLSTTLIFLIARRLTGSQRIAALAALIFLADPHAQQTLWDVSFFHMVLSVPILLTSLYAYMSGRRKVAWLLALLSLGVDESGLLLIAVLGLYELIVACPAITRGTLRGWRSLSGSVLRLAPFAILTIGYLSYRILPGGIYGEVTDPCRSPRCLATTAGEYFDRSLLRPDLLISGLWTHQVIFVALGLVVVALAIVVTRPWGWREKRVAAFVVAWWATATSFFALTLPGYIADRFLYVPDAALAILLAVVVLRTGEMRTHWSSARKWASYAAAGVLVVWIAAGPWMLFNRGQLNIQGGDQAASILQEIHALVPDPPQDAVFVIRDVPVYGLTQIPPGNTGPYLFNNGLPSAIRLEYGRSDLTVVVGRDNTTPAPAGAYLFDIQNGSAMLLPN